MHDKYNRCERKKGRYSLRELKKENEKSNSNKDLFLFNYSAAT